MTRNKPVILVIDDEAEFLEALKNYFSIRGYDIMSASNGKSGMNIARDKRPDIVLTDLKMPDLDGEELLMRIRISGLPSKVIFISAYDDGGATRARLIRLGALSYFDKPMASLKNLENVILDAFNKKEQSNA